MPGAPTPFAASTMCPSLAGVIAPDPSRANDAAVPVIAGAISSRPTCRASISIANRKPDELPELSGERRTAIFVAAIRCMTISPETSRGGYQSRSKSSTVAQIPLLSCRLSRAALSRSGNRPESPSIVTRPPVSRGASRAIKVWPGGVLAPTSTTRTSTAGTTIRVAMLQLIHRKARRIRRPVRCRDRFRTFRHCVSLSTARRHQAEAAQRTCNSGRQCRPRPSDRW